ncbi:MAG: glycosyltransferase family 4 protein [Bacteroidota bacterium]
MKVLFLTIVKIDNIEERGIYNDLLRKFRDEGHEVFIVTSLERREQKATSLIKANGVSILQVKTLNLQKVNIVEKGIGTLLIEYQYLQAIKNYLPEETFNVILYSTPPITFSSVIKFIKNRDNAYSYLLLKDIFPQNAIDMKMIGKGGLIHRFFLKKERELYRISDVIGCMSEANRNYILKYNPTIPSSKVEVNPNSITPIDIEYLPQELQSVREKYGVPLDKKVFVYGGNLGKPQGIDFLLETIENCEEKKAFFLIIGSGTEYDRIHKWFQQRNPQNALLLAGLPKNDYDVLLKACDIGMIFLHKDFTIPNFPSRLLSYLEMRMPVIAATDINSDIGSVIEEAKCGYWVETGNLKQIELIISQLCVQGENYEQMKINAWQLIKNEYNIEKSYELIAKKMKNV